MERATHGGTGCALSFQACWNLAASHLLRDSDDGKKAHRERQGRTTAIGTVLPKQRERAGKFSAYTIRAQRCRPHHRSPPAPRARLGLLRYPFCPLYIARLLIIRPRPSSRFRHSPPVLATCRRHTSQSASVHTLNLGMKQRSSGQWIRVRACMMSG